MRYSQPQKPKHTGREKEAAYKRLEKATNEELELISTHILGYNAFAQGRKELRLPSEVRGQVLKIIKAKLIMNQIDFQKHD